MAGVVAHLVVKVSASVSDFEKQMGGLEKSLGRTGAKLQSIGGDLTKGLTLPLAGLAVASVKMSTDFETAMTKVRTLASESSSNIAILRQGILDLAPSVGIGPTALADALLVIESTGFRGAAAMDVLSVSAKASAVGLGDTEGVARALTAAINAYGSENLSAAQAADVLFATVDAGGAEATELAGELGRVVGLASQMGVSFQEVGAFIATYTRLGLSAAEATTGLSGVLNTLLSPSAEATKALIGMGTSIGELRASVAEKGLSAALLELQERFKGNTEGAAAVFGNVRALAGIMGTAGSQATTYREVLDQISNSSNILNERFAIWRTTTAATWREFTAQVQVAGIQLGEVLAPAFSRVLQAAVPLLDAMVKLISWFSQLPQPVQTFTIGALALGAALGPVLYAIGSLMKVSSGLIGAFRLFGSTSVAATVGVRGLGLAFGWPFAAIVTGIGGITLALKGLERANQDAAKGGIVVGGEGMVSVMPELGSTEDYDAQLSALDAFLKAKQSREDYRKAIAAQGGGIVLASGGAGGANLPKAAAEVSEFERAVRSLTDRLSGTDLVDGVNQWMSAIERVGGIGALTHDELMQFQNDVAKAVEKMRIMGDVVPRTWALIADSIRNNSILQATRDSLGDSLSMVGLNEQQLLLQSSQIDTGLMTAPSVANQNISGGIKQVAEMSETFKAIARVIENVQTAINGSFAQMLLGAKGFKDGFLDIWNSLKAGVMNILNSILSSFINSFLKGMLGSLMGQKGAFSSAFSELFGGGGLKGLFGGAAGGGGAPGAPGGGGMGAMMTNPWAIGAAGAVALGIAVWKGGLFRGGEEALKVNRPRDQFLAQFGMSGTGEGSGFANLAAKLTEITGQAGGGGLFEMLKSADTLEEFNAATAAINLKLEEGKTAQQNLTTATNAGTVGVGSLEVGANAAALALQGLAVAATGLTGAGLIGAPAPVPPIGGERGSGGEVAQTYLDPGFDPGTVEASGGGITIHAGTIIGNPQELANMMLDAIEGGGQIFHRYSVLNAQAAG